YFTDAQDNLARGLVQSLAATLQLPGVERVAARWETSEIDATGRYLAAYERSGATVAKRKLRYELPDAKVSGAATYQIDADGWPETLASDEQLAIESAPVSVHTHSRITLTCTGTSIIAIAPIDLATLDVHRIGEPSRHHDAQADRDTLGTASLA